MAFFARRVWPMLDMMLVGARSHLCEERFFTMGTYPTSPRTDFLQWCQDHVEIFEDNYAAVGITQAQASAFKKAVDDATASEGAQSRAKQAAKAATDENTQRFGILRKSVSGVVRSIKTFAENTDNDNVYVIAQIPPPATPGSTPPPGKPFAVSVQLDTNTGAPVLKWKASNPPRTSGTSYIIRRKLPGESTYSFIGVTGSKTYTDNAFTAGPDSVQYTIQGQRSDKAGAASDVFTVNFGRAPGMNGGFGGGENFVITSTSSEGSKKKAA